MITAVTPFAAYAAARIGIPAVWKFVLERFTSSVDATTPVEPLDAKTANWVALAFAFMVTARLAKSFWGRRQTTEAWGKGAQGERMTGSLLSRLPATYIALHDLRMPGSKANIDHVVIGPTGVFTVETKHYSSAVVISGRDIRSGRRSLTPVVEQAKRQAAAVAGVLTTAVIPIVVVQGAGIRLAGWFTKPEVGGVRFCSGSKLATILTSSPPTLDTAQVRLLSERVQRGLAPR